MMVTTSMTKGASCLYVFLVGSLELIMFCFYVALYRTGLSTALTLWHNAQWDSYNPQNAGAISPTSE
jgi:hypothetical protein